MANLVESLREQLRVRLEQVEWEVRRREVGHVVRVGDGVAYLRGMPSVRYGELLECCDGLSALAFDLRSNEVGTLFLGPADQVAVSKPSSDAPRRSPWAARS
jgi:F-type H+-transporting ATPase subunit alpha